MEKKYNVDSFNLDHTKVIAPFVRLAAKKVGEKGDIVTKFDIRFCQPNKEFMSTGAIHTLEHLMAEYIRDEMEGVIDLSPMGCRTGFYFTVWGDRSEEEIANHAHHRNEAQHQQPHQGLCRRTLGHQHLYHHRKHDERIGSQTDRQEIVHTII